VRVTPGLMWQPQQPESSTSTHPAIQQIFRALAALVDFSALKLWGFS
jgi:hypothetical protein